MQKNTKAEWMKLLAQISIGRRSTECVRAFDHFTGDVYSAGHISFDEFLMAQHAIAGAYKGAQQMAKLAA